MIGGIVLAIAAVMGGVRLWHTYSSPTIPDSPQPSASAMKPATGEPIRFGRKAAPVTLSLYEDFRCPHCQDFESEAGRTISELTRSGRLKVQIYPLTFVEPESGSRKTANAFGCAAAAGFGPTYRAGLFANHKLTWTDDQLIKLGRGIDATAAKSAGFAGCVRDDKQRDWLDSIAKVAHRHKVRETPTVFINGHRKSGAAEWTKTKLRDEVRQAK